MSDYQLGDTLYFNFTTRAFATGIPTVLAGTPVISIYEDNSTTQITAGITLIVSLDSVVGLNNVAVVATGGNGFETGKFYSAVITTGTVGGVSVVGEVVKEFSLEASAAALDLANGTDGLGAIKTDTAAILVDTSTTLDTKINTIDTNVDSILVDTGATLPAQITTAQNDLDIITGASGVNLLTATQASIDAIEVDTSTTLDTKINTIDTNVDSILVDTGTTLPAQITALNNVAATDIVSSGAITTSGGAVSTVTTVGTTTTNTDMRGTDNAATATNLATVDSNVDAILVDTSTTLPGLIDDLAVKKNATFSNFEFLMVLTSDHATPATGLTVTGQRSIDGAAFGSVAGAIAEVSNGIYQFDALAADTNGDLITWRFSSATADDTFVTFKTVA